MYKIYFFRKNKPFVSLKGKNLFDARKLVAAKDVSFAWIDMASPTTEELEEFQEAFNIHPLEVEDALNVEEQSSKIEEKKDHVMMTFMNVYLSKKNVDAENLAFFMFKNIVVSIRAHNYSLYNETFTKIAKRSKLLKSPSSVVHTFLDISTDRLAILLDKIDRETDDLENKLLKNRERNIINDIYTVKDRLINIKRAVVPQKETLSYLTKPGKFVSAQWAFYFRDVYDHVIIALNQLELLKESTNNIIDLYLSLSSQNLNEVMKTLTALTMIFLPLTLITGIYGMNFRYMPELPWKYGYLFAISMMMIVLFSSLYLLRKKKWI